ncbi:MAG: carboxypeptidase regulatory-like domain-containing protein [candidate division Zixibacteria bacterium]|nr:carboxypeptidase regulatory-like domain-containing protein [candidate division Zixibacteria bacterium]
MRSKSILIFALVLISVVLWQSSKVMAFSVIDRSASGGEEIYARVWVTSVEEKGRLLGEKGLVVDAAGPNWVDVVIDSERLDDLLAKGYNVEVIFWTPEERNVALFGKDWEKQWHTYSTMVAEMEQAASDHPDIMILDTLGYSVQNRMILGVKISDNPALEDDEPEFRIIGCHHGNEYMSVEMALLMLEYLTDNYGSVPQVTHLVNDLEIWIIPMMNPDGRTAGSRYNANGADLNRDYGHMWNYASPGIFSQPETRVIREHGMKNNFSISLSFHTSGDIVNYVWNYKDFPVADSAFIVDISEEYGSYNYYWVVEGYQWYVVFGDCNDWSYGCRGDIDATIETDNYNIPNVWNQNRDAMLAMMERTDDGVRGIVTNASTGEPLSAMVRCMELGLPVFTDPVVGDYQKNLLPGTYTLKFSADGYQDTTISGVAVSGGSPTILNISLRPGLDLFAVHVISCYFYDPYYWPNQYQNNPTNASAVLGLPDEVFASLGKGGHIEVDMGEGTPIVDIDGDDFTVYEVGTSDGYHVYWSSLPYGGTWNYIGSGFGTTSFDISSLSDTIRYLKIVDDNDGSATEWYPGCDIDAVTHPRAVTGPYLTLYTYHVDDDSLGQSLGNNDGDVDFGETIELTIVLENIGDSTAYNVEATLSTPHPLVSVIDSQKTFGNIPVGDTMASDAEFVFSVSTEISDGEIIPFQLDINATNGSWSCEGPNISVHAPLLVYYSLDIDDIVGNGDGEADPGETCNLTVTLKNEGGHEGKQVQAILVSNDLYVTVTSGTSSYPDILPESTGASLTPYQVAIEDDSPVGHSASLILEIDAFGPYSSVDTFKLIIGQKPILFVDDDDGESYETYFLTALDSVGLAYDVWTYKTQGCPPDSVLELYQAVVWSTGDDYGSLSDPATLNATDQARLMTYLDNGGCLFLSSQDFLLDNNPNTFIIDYLHVAGHDDDETIGSVSGISGDTVSDGMAFSLSYPFYNFSDHIVPGAGAVGIFYETSKAFSVPREGVQIDHTSGAGVDLVNYCALRYPASGQSTYQVVFFAFPFEAIPQTGSYPNNSYTLMRRIMDWFGLEKPAYMHGDANGDKIVDLADVVYLINYLYKDGAAPEPLEAGDANCDEMVDLGDVVYLINYLYRDGPPPC